VTADLVANFVIFFAELLSHFKAYVDIIFQKFEKVIAFDEVDLTGSMVSAVTPQGLPECNHTPLLPRHLMAGA